MRNLLKLKLFFLLIYITFLTSNLAAADKILPIPKPTVDAETKNITAKKKEIYPLKKPKSVETKIEEDTQEIIQETSQDVTEVANI